MAARKTPANEERVEIFIPRGSANDDPNFFVSVNAVNYLLPRGRSSMVPRAVADEIKRSMAAQIALDEKVERMLANGEV